MVSTNERARTLRLGVTQHSVAASLVGLQCTTVSTPSRPWRKLCSMCDASACTLRRRATDGLEQQTYSKAMFMLEMLQRVIL